MFFPGKEEFIFLEEQMRRQKQIYNDAADAGVAMNTTNREQFRHAIKELLKNFKSTRNEVGKKTDPHYCWSVSFFIPIEMDEGMTVGYRVEFSYIRDSKTPSRMNKQETEWASIDIQHTGVHAPASTFIREVA